MSNVRRRKSAVDRKLEIIETTIRLSADLGPDRVTTQHVADEVGLTQPAIFRHFSTKSEMWDAVSDHVISLFHPLSPGATVGNEALNDPHQTLCNVLVAQLEFMVEHPAICAIISSRELHAANESLRRKLAAMMRRRRRALADIIEQAISKGQHRADIVAEDAAALILVAAQGLSAQWNLEKKGFDLVDEGSRLLHGLAESLRT